MPLPTPTKSETQDEFIGRCMGNDTMREDFPDDDQRLAVCMSQWGDRGAGRMMEKRAFTFTVEQRDGDTPQLRGHAAVFNEWTDILWWSERILPGAFADAISGDVRALFNHDPNFVLGRSTAGTLTLMEDDKGLYVEIDPPNTQFARDLMLSIRRGDISQMSFAFTVDQEKWTAAEKDQKERREIVKVRTLYDVSPVTFPAYAGTDIAVRSWEAWHTSRQQSVNWVDVLRTLRRRYQVKRQAGGY